MVIKDDFMKKSRMIKPWRASFFQNLSEGDKKLYDQLSDLYLVKKVYKDKVIYQINNDKKEVVLEAKCYLKCGSLVDIELYSRESYNRLVLNLRKDIPDYVVIKDESTIGKLQILEDRLYFINLENEIVYSAILVSAYNSYRPMKLTLISEWFYKTEFHFAFKGKENDNLGRYFMALCNLDLTCDKKVVFNRYIASLLAIFIDVVIASLIKPLPRTGIGDGFYC